MPASCPGLRAVSSLAYAGGMTGDAQTAIAEGLQALAARDHLRAADLLRSAASEPGADFPWLALGNAELALGRHDAAEAAIERRLEEAPREVVALLLKGFLREQAGDARGATSLLPALRRRRCRSRPPASPGRRSR